MEMNTEANGENIPALIESFDSAIRPLLDMIDSIRNIKGLQTVRNFPQIVVLGDQSSGKSSLLEAISGTELPKKSGMATRCPLVIQMRKSQRDFHAVISYELKKKGTVRKEIHDPGEICEQISSAQDEITSHKNHISTQPITLQITSSTSPDLTLVDLPGLIRSVSGDQPKNTPKIIRELVEQYIQRDKTIILCVVSGELDIQLNESLDMALEVDPLGKRTLGVITKPDLIRLDDRENKARLLRNEEKQLGKGYTMIYCRSSEEIKTGMTLSDAVTREQQFFENHEMFLNVDKRLLGTKMLTTKMTKILKDSIKNELPALRQSLEEAQIRIRKELKNRHELPPEEQENRQLYFIEIRDRLHDRFRACLKQGQFKEGHENLFNEWRKIYNDTYDTIKEKTKKFVSHHTVKELEKYMKQQRGEELPNMDSFSNLKSLLTSHFVKYEPELEACAAQVKSSIENKLFEITEEELKDFPEFQCQVKGVISLVLAEQNEELKKLIEDYFGAENLIFVANEESICDESKICKDKKSWTKTIYLIGFIILAIFIAMINKFRQANLFEMISIAFTLLILIYLKSFICLIRLDVLFKVMFTKLFSIFITGGNQGLSNVERMYNTLRNYLEVADQRIGDNMPTFIRLYLNNKAEYKLRVKITELMKSDNFSELLKMDEEVLAHRKELTDELHNIEEALVYVKKI